MSIGAFIPFYCQKLWKSHVLFWNPGGTSRGNGRSVANTGNSQRSSSSWTVFSYSFVWLRDAPWDSAAFCLKLWGNRFQKFGKSPLTSRSFSTVCCFTHVLVEFHMRHVGAKMRFIARATRRCLLSSCITYTEMLCLASTPALSLQRLTASLTPPFVELHCLQATAWLSSAPR